MRYSLYASSPHQAQMRGFHLHFYIGNFHLTTVYVVGSCYLT